MECVAVVSANPRELKQVLAFDGVKQKGTGEGVQRRRGRVNGLPLLESRVPRHADVSQRGHLFSSQPVRPSAPVAGPQAHRSGCEPRAPAPEEVREASELVRTRGCGFAHRALLLVAPSSTGAF